MQSAPLRHFAAHAPRPSFGPFALTALHQSTCRARAGTVARLHTSHHADAPESCHVPDRGSVPRRPLFRSRQPAVGQAAQHSSDECAVRALHGLRTLHRGRPPHSRFPLRLLRSQRRTQSPRHHRRAQGRTGSLGPRHVAEPRAATRRPTRAAPGTTRRRQTPARLFHQFRQRGRGDGHQVLARPHPPRRTALRQRRVPWIDLRRALVDERSVLERGLRPHAARHPGRHVRRSRRTGAASGDAQVRRLHRGAGAGRRRHPRSGRQATFSPRRNSAAATALSSFWTKCRPACTAPDRSWPRTTFRSSPIW